MKLKHLLYLSATLAVTTMLTACPDPTPDPTPSIDIIAKVSCSPDLLEFVVPNLQIIPEEGKATSYTLNPEDFKETEEGSGITIIVNGVESGSTRIDNIAEYTRNFDNVTSIQGNIVVSYTRKPDVTVDKESYIFFHQVDYTYKQNNVIFSQTINNYWKPIAYKLTSDEVETYIENLTSTPDEIIFKVPK